MQKPELWSSFWSKNLITGKIIFPLIFLSFFGHFFKNFVLGLCWVSKVIYFRVGNSILNSRMHFPLSLYHSLSHFRIFPLQETDGAFWLYHYSVLSLLGGKNYPLFWKTIPFVVNTTALIYLTKYSDKNWID